MPMLISEETLTDFFYLRNNTLDLNTGISLSSDVSDL